MMISTVGSDIIIWLSVYSCLQRKVSTEDPCLLLSDCDWFGTSLGQDSHQSCSPYDMPCMTTATYSQLPNVPPSHRPYLCIGWSGCGGYEPHLNVWWVGSESEGQDFESSASNMLLGVQDSNKFSNMQHHLKSPAHYAKTSDIYTNQYKSLGVKLPGVFVHHGRDVHCLDCGKRESLASPERILWWETLSTMWSVHHR